MKRIKPPFAYYGGKTFLAPWIVEHLPPHRTYVELFGGSGAVLLAKEPAPVEVFNDIDEGVTNFFAVLRDRESERELIRRLIRTPYSFKEYYDCLRTWRSCSDPVEKARRWAFVMMNSYNGRFGAGLKRSAKASSRGKPTHVSAYHSCIRRLRAVARRFRSVVIENRDFREVVKTYDTEDTVFYADPPYVLETRHEDGTYVHEMNVYDHEELVQLALSTKGVWVISGYDHPVYAPLERAGWTKLERPTHARSSARKPARSIERVEILWISPGHKTVTNRPREPHCYLS